MDNTLEKDIYIGGDELVFDNENNNIQSGGFSVSAIMNKIGMSPIQTFNNELQTGGNSSGSEKVSDLFQNLAVPNWATMYNMKGGEYKGEYKGEKKHHNKNKIKNKDDDTDSDSDSDSDIDDDLHDKLLELVKEHENKLKQKHKKTRRNPKIERKNANKTKNKRRKIKGEK